MVGQFQNGGHYKLPHVNLRRLAHIFGSEFWVYFSVHIY